MADRNIDKKRTYVNKDLCIACNTCVALDDSETFFMDEDGFANTQENDKQLDDIKIMCPTSAIFVKTLEEYKNRLKSSEDDE